MGPHNVPGKNLSKQRKKPTANLASTMLVTKQHDVQEAIKPRVSTQIPLRITITTITAAVKYEYEYISINVTNPAPHLG